MCTGTSHQREIKIDFPLFKETRKIWGERDVMWPIRTRRPIFILSLPALCKHCIGHHVVSSKWIFAETTPKTAVITSNKRSCYNIDIGVSSTFLSDPNRHDDIVYQNQGHTTPMTTQLFVAGTHSLHANKNKGNPSWRGGKEKWEKHKNAWLWRSITG